MKTKNKVYTLLLLATGFTLTSCIEETIPENSSATAKQIGESASALEGLVNGIPSQMSLGYLVYGDQTHETDMAYPAYMIAQTEMLGDMYPAGSDSGYDWYRNYNTFSRAYGKSSYFAYLPWFTFYKFIKSCNDVIASVDFESENTNDEILGLASIAYACRAFDYYMLTVLYEPQDNIYTDISNAIDKESGEKLTVPFVTEQTDAAAAKNNPRAKHSDMMAFIISDLDKAERGLANYKPQSRLYPDLSVVYGLKAKVYLWDEKFDSAAVYARKAIDTFGGKVMTASEWEDPKSAFARAAGSWMWYLHYSPENMGNLCNFTGWMSSEAEWGYASLTCPAIDKSLYDKIADNDFRKNVFLNPRKFAYYDYKTSRDEKFINDAPDYLALKFRCLEGNTNDYAVGGAIDVPVMRLEEMLLIEAEALAVSQGVSAGIEKLEDFMRTRQPDYTCPVTNLRAFQLEVLTQMRIEFWGEGNAFPSAKRLKPGVMQNYTGTNAPEEIFLINCEGIKPNWNLVIPQYEIDANQVLESQNNPDPTTTVVAPSPINQYAPGNTAAN